jgi:NADH:ubiquinone oxidoreductase subunit 6 (subunit J)
VCGFLKKFRIVKLVELQVYLAAVVFFALFATDMIRHGSGEIGADNTYK